MTAPDIDEAVRAMTNDEIDTATHWAERALSRHFPQPCECSECTMGRAIVSLVAENKRLHASRDAEAKVVEAVSAWRTAHRALSRCVRTHKEQRAREDLLDSASRLIAAFDDLIRLRAGKEGM